ncbi:hypothetical protein HFD88_004195 [Aspergillus terreus]|nr:hypothetical protein HFD88_004195 [Aspergillus terreus]
MNTIISPSTPKVLIFGSQALGFDSHAADHLRTALLQTPECAWLLDSLAELRTYWADAVAVIPALQDFPGAECLEDLSTWLRTGAFTKSTFPLPNTILTPLVVVYHLIQYLQFLSVTRQTEDRLSASFIKTTESMGLCTGLLAATAVACSATRADLRLYGAVAVRLAMLVGSIVDAQNQASGGNQSFTIAWSSAALGETAREIIERDPDAYISVTVDEMKATVTTSARAAPALQKELKTVGIIMADISLAGRFHTPDHEAVLQALHAFCDTHPEFQFPNAHQLVFPTRSNTDNAALIQSGALHRITTRSMLTEQCQWFQAFKQIDASTSASGNAVAVVFGTENGAPGWLSRKLGPRLVMLDQLSPLELPVSRASLLDPQAPVPYRKNLGSRGVAVVGMSAMFAGSPDLDHLWQVLCSGTSKHIEVPPERFTIETPWRKMESNRKWYANFIDDYDTFDHRFFKKSPREMASTDPQHRLMLQAAYQAVEQSGYFNQADPNKEVGCYIGVGLVDYERNIACAPANAYSATGNLKSFAAGKISHYFGWTGPGLTVDTACSSSAVAVNLACQAILSGRVKGALAGGVNIMTSPEWFQNLAGASFLSATGQCKPFDARGDGYCRGEGVGAVFLKPVELALADGDQILGIIAASNVYQNENCTPITVPNAPSLSDLFRDTISQAGLEPQHISYVEAHGTGTPVGDPAEYDGIRSVVGGKRRHDTLTLGSVKGAIGHTESASGIAALLKTLLMLNQGAIPPQASFQTLSPGINASPADKIEIPTSLRPWTKDFRAALINNYGASGSNACMVVTQGPPRPVRTSQQAELEGKHPFWITGLGDDSLQRYAAALREYLQRHPEVSLASLAFQMARQSNRQLPRALIFGCSSVAEVMGKLARVENGDTSAAKTQNGDGRRPVVLCFGGQVSTFVGLSPQLYEQVTIFRHWLNEYDVVCQSIGLGSIFPDIWQKSPVQDTVKLQTMLFGAQYACARSWIDSGVQPAALVGFSFGELTALCVSGILSLRDAIQVVAGRAQLIQENWGPEKGAMMAVEGPRESVDALLTATAEVSDGSACIACFNGPTSFTLAGSAAAINTAAQKAQAGGIRHKKLNVTNAFHSSLVEPLRGDLEQLGQEVEFRPAVIPLEHATDDDRCSQPLGPSFFADHLRNPVHFNQAARRLAQKYPNAIWLEAGFNSTIANIAQRALEGPKSCHFQSLNLDDSLQGLTDATLKLWEEGLNVRYWPHHAMQASMYDMLLLPPYQFEKSRHWMKLQPIPSVEEVPFQPSLPPKTMWTFLGYQDSQQCAARFQINTTNEQFHTYVSSHVIAQTAPLCPSTLQLSIAIDALMSLYGSSKVQPEAKDLVNHAPMALSPALVVWLDAQRTDAGSGRWSWKMSSTSTIAPEKKPTVHATGDIIFRSADDDQLSEELERYQHLIGQARCQALLYSPNADEVLTGTKIYRRFSDIVEYGPMYRGLQKLVGKDHESAGRVVHAPPPPGTTSTSWLDTGLADSFCQVAGIFINVMTNECSPAEVYISNRIDRWFRSRAAPTDAAEWEVFATHRRPTAKRFLSDVFVFDPKTGRLAEVILGIHYQLVPKAALCSILGKPTPSPAASTMHVPNGNTAIAVQPVQPLVPVSENVVAHSQPSAKPASKGPAIDIGRKTREIIANVSGLEAAEIRDESDLNELGIDSLMGMELAREIEGVFSCSFEADQLLNVTTFNSLVSLIGTVLGVGEEDEVPDEEASAVPAQAEPLNGVNGHTNGLHAANGVNGVNGVSRVNGVNGVAIGTGGAASLPASVVLDAFAECKAQTDRFIQDCRFGGYSDEVLPKSNELCTALIVDAFEQLGCPLRTAQPGDVLSRITALPRHRQFVDWIYTFLERDARLIQKDGDRIERTAVSTPQQTARALLDELVSSNSDHVYDHELTYMTGTRLADCLTGKADGLQLIFGNPEGREVVSNMYGKSPINQVWVTQMQAFLKSLLSRLDTLGSGSLNILELGAGTGGTTAKMLPLLSALGVSVQYTVTDISASLVAAARKRFKEYPWVRAQVLDIEKPAPAELQRTQHIIIATNCVHATHSLTTSTGNIRQLLRPDGFLMMLEMTQLVPWVDLVFGPIEGWWLFNDGRSHALSPPEGWERALNSVGYGHVDWTDGHLPEAGIQRIIIALAEGPRYARSSITPVLPVRSADLAQREAAIEHYICQHLEDFAAPSFPLCQGDKGMVPSKGRVFLVTGATGSLGSHLVAHLSSRPDVRAVFCANRRSSGIEAEVRQVQMLSMRGISLDAASRHKLHVLEVDTTKPRLGLTEVQYASLATQITDIVHNAWPMSITRGIQGFTAQFQAMRNLIDLACHAQSHHHQQVGFQFISSIATVGHQPLWTKDPLVLEKPVGTESVLPTGYGDAKLACERMLDRSLGQAPNHFRTMSVRIGQISGSTASGYWNPVEHFAFLIKSSQTVRALPCLRGSLSWCPVTDVAATLGDLLLSSGPHPYPIYHIENPRRQPWDEILATLADALGLEASQVVPFAEWTQRVRQFGNEPENPAVRIIDFLETNFERMSCGGLVLDTTHSLEHSATLRHREPVPMELVRKYIRAWQEMGFLR